MKKTILFLIISNIFSESLLAFNDTNFRKINSNKMRMESKAKVNHGDSNHNYVEINSKRDLRRVQRTRGNNFGLNIPKKNSRIKKEFINVVKIKNLKNLKNLNFGVQSNSNRHGENIINIVDTRNASFKDNTNRGVIFIPSKKLNYKKISYKKIKNYNYAKNTNNVSDKSYFVKKQYSTNKAIITNSSFATSNFVRNSDIQNSNLGVYLKKGTRINRVTTIINNTVTNSNLNNSELGIIFK